jgi:hypothetical protein
MEVEEFRRMMEQRERDKEIDHWYSSKLKDTEEEDLKPHNVDGHPTVVFYGEMETNK